MIKTEQSENVTYILDIMRRIITSICGYPDALEMITIKTPGFVMISLRGHASDTPRMIGAGGVTYAAIRLLAAYYGSRNGVKITLLPILESKVGSPGKAVFVPSTTWDTDRVAFEGLLKEAVREAYGDGAMVDAAEDMRVVSAYNVNMGPGQNAAGVFVDEALKRLFEAAGRKLGRVVVVNFV